MPDPTTTPTPTKVYGDAAPVLTSAVPSINGGSPTYTYTGPAATLGTWAATALAKHASKRVEAQVSVNGATATLTITETEDPAESAPPGQAVDVRTPTLTLSMGTFARPIETIDKPTDFTKITPSRCAEIRQLVNTNNSTGLARLTGVEATYATLLAQGITSRADPCYQAQATRYIRLDTSFAATVGDPTAILGWSDVVEWLGNAKASYANPDAALKWRATGLQIAIREKRYAEVSKTFEGAYWWPPALYGSGSQETT